MIGFGETQHTLAPGTLPEDMAYKTWTCAQVNAKTSRVYPGSVEPVWVCSNKSLWERKSTWAVLGAVAASVLVGVAIGRATKKGR